MGYKVKEFREKLKMTQEELSEKSGVCRATISGLENGTLRMPSSKTMVNLARALGTTLDKIFFTDDV